MRFYRKSHGFQAFLSKLHISLGKSRNLLSAVKRSTLARYKMRWLLPIIALAAIARAQLNASDVTYIADGPEANISSAGKPMICSERMLMRTQGTRTHWRERLRRLLYCPRQCANRQAHRPNPAPAIPSSGRAENLPGHFHSQHAGLRRVPDRRRTEIVPGGGGRFMGIFLSGGAQDI